MKKISILLLFFFVCLPLSGLAQMNPFGGLITRNVYCECNNVRWITHNGVAGPSNLMYVAGETKLFQCRQIDRSSIWILGIYGANADCIKVDPSDGQCKTFFSAPRMLMVGTSGCTIDTTNTDNNDDGGTNPPTTPPDQCRRMGESAFTYPSRGTGYYPDNSALEGGFEDMHGISLKTLQQFLAGRSSYVSVAMDKGVFPYGTELCIPELEQKYGKQIIFKVVDTGGAFTGKGTSRIDICTENEAASTDSTINGSLQLVSKKAAKK